MLRKKLGQVGLHRVHPMVRSCSGVRERNKFLWMCWTCSWIVFIPSGELGTNGLLLLCMGQEVT